MNIVTKTKRDTFLRTKNRFYQCGWLDAERDEPAQASTRSQDENFYQEYLKGYKESMSNQYAMEGC
jgi:ribosome modulation factor